MNAGCQAIGTLDLPTTSRHDAQTMPKPIRHAMTASACLALPLLMLCAGVGCQSNGGDDAREFRPREAPPMTDAGSADAEPLLRAAPTRPAGAWVPNAIASFITIDRSTSYALVHDDDRAVLIIAAAEDVDGGEGLGWVGSSTGTNYLWWVVEMPNAVAEGQTITLGARHRAWLLERVPGQPTHGSPASGSVVVRGVSGDSLVLDLDILAPIGRPTAGQGGVPAIRTSERVSLARRVPLTLDTPEIDSISGTQLRPEPVRLPIWTALGPDEWKPAGWKYESPGRRRR